jgi:hypothetical protein
MKSFSRLLASAAVFAVLLTVPGCGGSDDGPVRYEVTGNVTLGGKALPSGTIQFVPQGPPEIGGGATIENGLYTISEDQGLPEGEYLVRISSAGSETAAAEEVPGEAPPPAKDLIPAEYNVNSDKKIKVTADGENKFDFAIP